MSGDTILCAAMAQTVLYKPGMNGMFTHRAAMAQTVIGPLTPAGEHFL